MGLALGHFFRVISQLIELGSNGFGGRQFLIGVAALGDQLAAHFCCCQPRVQTRGAKLRIRLTLPIYDRRDIAQQVRQMLFAALAPTQLEAIHADNPVCHFVLSLTDRPAIPPQLSFGEPLAAFAQRLHRPRHKHAPRAALEVNAI